MNKIRHFTNRTESLQLQRAGVPVSTASFYQIDGKGAGTTPKIITNEKDGNVICALIGKNPDMVIPLWDVSDLISVCRENSIPYNDIVNNSTDDIINAFVNRITDVFL